MALGKRQLRTEMRARRLEMPDKHVVRYSCDIRTAVLRHDSLQDVGSVFVYVSVPNEPATQPLIEELIRSSKRVSVPRIGADGRMHAHRIQSMDDLVPSGPEYFHIPVPPADAPIEEQPELGLVPGLAFTKTGQRLGMGGGYYDRYLGNHPDTLAVGLCYGWQVLDTLPHEPHDRLMQHIVTESQALICM